MTDPTDGNPAAQGDVEPPARDHEHGTELRTFLIADVRGYTRYTAEFGDEAAGRLATRFAELVEEVVATRGGFLLELRGDEALVVFVSARQALRAAVELQERFLTAGLARGVGIGLDAGEAVPVGDGFRGSALNLAARLCAQAGPGEIIASEAVIHLAARLDGISYVEPRSFRLKGLAEPIRAVGVVASSRVPHGIRRRVRRARQLGAERKVLGAGVVAGLALVIGALALSGAFTAKPGPSAAASHDTSSPVAVASAGPATGPGVAFLNAATGKVTALNDTLRRPIDGQWVGSNLWVYDADPAAFHRIDPSSGSINRSISTTIPVGRWLVDGNAIWVTDHERPTLHRIDIPSGRETDAFPLSSDPTDTRSSGGIVQASGSLWIALFGPSTSSVVRVDPQSGSIVAMVDDLHVTDLAATDNRIWGSTPWGLMTPIDPETTTAGPTTGIPGPIQSVAVVGNDAWAANRENGAVYQVQPGRDIAISHFGFPNATSVSSGDGKLWVGGGQTATALDAGSGQTTSYPIGHAVSDVEAAAGTVAVLSAKGIEDALAGLSGVVRIASPGNPFDVIDPAIRRDVGSEERDQIDQATCARLLNYRDKPAPEGSHLEPEVAEAMPIVSPDGLTYTFQVRSGFAFSPPSGEPITADTFRATIERALDPRLGSNSEGIDLLGDVVGAQEFHSGKARKVSGLSVAGDSLKITLRAASSSFLQRLALPAFCPVPIGTARVLGGVNDPPLPGSGAMYVADRVNGQYLILKRNANYGGTRKPGFAAIAWLLGVDSADAISRLEAGTIDVVPSGGQLAPGGPIDRAWGAGSNAARAGDQRYYVSDGRVTAFLALRSSDPLLSDPDVRRAIALVLDRNYMAGAFVVLPTSGMRSREMTGTARDEPFKLAGGSVQASFDAAMELMRGRTGAAVISFASGCDECQRMTGRMTGDLRSIGVGLTVEYHDDAFAAAEHPGSDISIVIDFVWQPYPDDAAIVDTVRRSIPKGWLGSDMEASIEDLDRLTGSARAASSAATLDRLEGTEARIIPFGAVWDAAYVGPNVGCVIFAPGAPHLDLVALCPKGP